MSNWCEEKYKNIKNWNSTMSNENYREKIVGKELKELCIAVINKL